LFNTIRRHAATIAAVVLVWMAYTDLSQDDGTAKAKDKVKLASIDARFMTTRGPDFVLAPVRDPIGINRPRLKPEKKPEPKVVIPEPEPVVIRYNPDEVARAWTGAFADLAAQTIASLQAWDPLGLKAENADADEPLPDVKFTLVLEATLGGGAHGIARVSGRIVNVGQVIEDLDPDTPPILRSVTGSRAVIVHRGDVYVLDLDHNPSVTVDTAAAEEES
jgi:hypothetical protein